MAEPLRAGDLRATLTDGPELRDLRFRGVTILDGVALTVRGADWSTVPGRPVSRSVTTTGDAVRVFVTVTDRDGRLVTTLEQKDFEIRDEGKPQPITLFDNSPQPIRLVVMLDVSGSMQGNLPLLREGTQELLSRLRPDDGVRLGTFGHDVSISPTFTRDPRELQSSLPRAMRFRSIAMPFSAA